ncbi:MAG: gamma-glutamyltransferase [Rhodospirillaceae bacterium]|nr:gamma-glutamyltransferase [Rhodospirillaceae bacterium]
MILACILLAGCGAGFPKVVVKLGEGDTTAADSLRPFVIATDDAVATRAGVAALRAGGTAGDAAAAAALMLAVVLPSSASLHAGGVCLIYDAAAKSMHKLEFAGPLASARAARTIHGVLGRLPWPRAVAPAATAARFGVPVSRRLAQQLAQADVLLRDAQALSVFMSPRRQLLAPGEPLRQPALADTLDRLRTAPRNGADVLPWAPAAADPYGGNQAYLAGKGTSNPEGASSLVVGDTHGNTVACTFVMGAAFGAGVMRDGALQPADGATPVAVLAIVDTKGRVVMVEANGGQGGYPNSLDCFLDKGAPECEAKALAPGGYALTGQVGEP